MAIAAGASAAARYGIAVGIVDIVVVVEGIASTGSFSFTADWEADSDNRWTVPVGGGVGKIQRFGKLPLNIQLQAFCNVEKPDNGADWQLRFQVQFLFPK